MPEDTSLAKIEAIREVIQKNLAIVQQALGIEVTNYDNLDELEIESEIVTQDTVSNFLQKRLTAAELAEEKDYVIAMQDASQARFVESQAMFAESVVRFNKSKDKFVRRKKVRNRFYRFLTFSDF